MPQVGRALVRAVLGWACVVPLFQSVDQWMRQFMSFCTMLRSLTLLIGLSFYAPKGLSREPV